MADKDEYLRRLDRHSHEARVDPLRDAARLAVFQWEREDEMDRVELSNEFWTAMRNLKTVLNSVKRGGSEVAQDEEVPEVEVTHDRSPVPVDAPERHPAARRSGAKNLSDPKYQRAFIEESRAAMGQPDVEAAKEFLERNVKLTFNVDWPPVVGKLTDVIENYGHPSGAPYLILDDYRERAYPLAAIQSIELV